MYCFKRTDTSEELKFKTMHEALHEKRLLDKEAGRLITTYPLYIPDVEETKDWIE